MGIYGVNIFFSRFNTDSPFTYFTVGKDEKMLNSISSTNEAHSAAYDVDFSTRYQEMNDAYKACQNIYSQTSIYRANVVDSHMDYYYNPSRSLANYAGLKNSYNPGSNKADLRSTWADFAKNETYQKMLAQGGTKSQDDVDELLAAAEGYIWQRAYTENGVYKDDMFDFANKLKDATGVTVVAQADDSINLSSNLHWINDNRITFGLNGSLCRMDNYTFQAMAKHQDHMDIWENALNGTYSSFADITDAVLSTDDDSLKKDWLSAITDGSKVTTADFGIEDNEDVYVKYVNVSLSHNAEGYDSSTVGTTAKDFWNEFNYNTYMTNDYSSSRDYKEYAYDADVHYQNHYRYMSVKGNLGTAISDGINAKANILNHTILDEEGNEYNPYTGELYRTADEQEAYINKLREDIQSYKDRNLKKLGKMDISGSVDDQISALQDKIKTVRKKISALKSAGNDETQNRNLAVYQKQLDTYKEQLAELQSEKLAKAKLDIMA